MTRYKSRFRELTIPVKKSYTKEVDGQIVAFQGEHIEFKDSIYQTDNEVHIKFLDTDPRCIQMQKNGVFAKIDSAILEAATKKETLEEREARLDKELKELKKKKKKVTEKEKGTKTKVGSKKDKPAY